MSGKQFFFGKGASVHIKRNFVPVHCYHCDIPLHTVLIGTEVMCPRCNRWYTAEREERVVAC